MSIAFLPLQAGKGLEGGLGLKLILLVSGSAMAGGQAARKPCPRASRLPPPLEYCGFRRGQSSRKLPADNPDGKTMSHGGGA
jgi:hypothetical protein